MIIEYFETAKQAALAGKTHFSTRKDCKHGHHNPVRKIVQNKPGMFSSKCTQCSAATKKKYEHKSGVAKIRAIKKEYKERNKHRGNEWRKNKLDTDPFHCQLQSIRLKCVNKNIPFDLDTAYLQSIFPENGKCPITGITMIRGMKGTDRKNWISVDRIRPDKGYIKGNVTIMSVYANSLKRDCTNPRIFENIAQYLRNHGLCDVLC